MTTSTTTIDSMGLQAAYANLHTDQERDYFMQRYHDVISSFGGFFFSGGGRHTRCLSGWSSDVCSSDLARRPATAHRSAVRCTAGGGGRSGERSRGGARAFLGGGGGSGGGDGRAGGGGRGAAGGSRRGEGGRASRRGSGSSRGGDRSGQR